MHFLDLTLPTPEENLALDEALLLAAEAHEAGEILRVWDWPQPTVVLGAGCKLAEDVDEASCDADGVPVLRRSSGGGTVLLGRGCLCFSLVLAFDRHEALAEVRSSYHHILGRLIDTFALPGLELEGISDLALGGRKVSGNAQQRKRHHLLHHGTLLHDFSLPLVSRYLRLPARQPEYRAGRTHETFVRNLEVSRQWLVERTRSAWGATEDRVGWPVDRVRLLVAEKYRQAEWVRRR